MSMFFQAKVKADLRQQDFHKYNKSISGKGSETCKGKSQGRQSAITTK